MARIFISYRREDTEGYTGRLYENLCAHFGEDQIFMDIDNIPPGTDFVEVLEAAVRSCDILIACIGQQWMTSVDVDGQRLLDNDLDFVRLEIATALKRNIRVIPVLLQGTTMPRARDLSDELTGLARRQALEVSSTRWRYDVGRLIAAIEQVIQGETSSYDGLHILRLCRSIVLTIPALHNLPTLGIMKRSVWRNCGCPNVNRSLQRTTGSSWNCASPTQSSAPMS